MANLTNLQYLPQSQMNSKVVLTAHEVSDLADWAKNVNLDTVVWGTYEKWSQSLMYYPIILAGQTTGHLKLYHVDYPEVACANLDIHDTKGYYVGNYVYPQCTDFTQYEPYTTLQVWLPFYGFADLKIADVQGKQMHFILYVDFNSGSAQYVIGVTDNIIESSGNPPKFLENVNEFGTIRQIGQYNFQLGYQIPITSTGMAEVARNVAMNAIKAGAGLIAGAALGGAAGLGISGISGASTIASTSTQTKQVLNPATGKMVTTGVQTLNKSTDMSSYQTQRMVNTAIDTVPTVLDNLNVKPTLDKSNNCVLNSGCCKSVLIIQRTVTPTVDRTNPIYKHLKGLPCGELGIIGMYSGYTELSDFHLEGEGFALATEAEKAELYNVLSQGIIL